MLPPFFRRLLIALVILAIGIGALLLARSCAAKRKGTDTTSPQSATPTPSSAAATNPATSAAADAAADPVAAEFRQPLDRARALPNPAARSQVFGRLFRQWLARDTEAALSYLRGLPPGNEHTLGLRLLLEAMAARDPSRALALASELATTDEQRQIYNALFARWAGESAHVAVQRLNQVPAAAKENAVRALAETWARTDRGAALTWASSLPPHSPERAFALESVLFTVADDDPLRAIELAQSSLTGPALDRILSTSLEKLLVQDFAAAKAVVPLLPSGEVQSAAALQVAQALADRNALDALAWTQTLASPKIQQLALHSVLDVWANRDPLAASQYVSQMPPGLAQQNAAERVARIIGGANPKTAIAWADTVPAGETQGAALTTIASAWAQTDPASASAWAAHLNEPSARSTALHSALSYWAIRDKTATRVFVGSLEGETQTRAAAFVAPLLAQSAPAATLSWAQSLPAPARAAAIEAAYARWHGNDRAAAETWLATANLPPEVKQRLVR